MRYHYNIYPDARKILDESGLTARIMQASKDDKIHSGGHVMESDVVDIIKHMKKEEFFLAIPEDERKAFGAAINAAWKEKETGATVWTIDHHAKKITEKIEDGDFITLVGWYATRFMEKAEIFDYKKFGFPSISALTGTVAAAISNELHDDTRRNGLRWTTTAPDGRIFTSVYEQNIHCDFYLMRTDITPYKTTDPLSADVQYRPQVREDRQFLAGTHSAEPEFLAGLLKWIDQAGLTPPSLQEKATPLLEWTRSLGQGGGTCAEHLFGNDRNMMHELVSFYLPMPVMQDDGTTDYPRTIYGVSSNHHGSYGMYTSPRNELIITHDDYVSDKSEKGMQLKRDEVMRFQPEEADHLLRGIMYQAARGHGRTAASTLASMLTYRFSEEFAAEMEEGRRKYGADAQPV